VHTSRLCRVSAIISHQSTGPFPHLVPLRGLLNLSLSIIPKRARKLLYVSTSIRQNKRRLVPGLAPRCALIPNLLINFNFKLNSCVKHTRRASALYNGESMSSIMVCSFWCPAISWVIVCANEFEIELKSPSSSPLSHSSSAVKDPHHQWKVVHCLLSPSPQSPYRFTFSIHCTHTYTRGGI